MAEGVSKDRTESPNNAAASKGVTASEHRRESPKAKMSLRASTPRLWLAREIQGSPTAAPFC
jgi:hypothetical protein